MSIAERWQESRIRFYRARIHHLIERGQWSRALTSVIDFAQWADGRIDDVELWLDMTVLATRIVGHLDDPAEYKAFLTHFAAPFLGDSPRPPRKLLKAFAAIADHVEPSVMTSIGRWLADARPHWPLGPYLVAHFREIEHRGSHDPAQIRETATFFHIAADRAERLDHDHWRLHGHLRLGALLLTTGTDRAEGRRILGELDWTGLHATEQLWMAIALSASGRWTDRMRAMDIVLDLYRAASTARPGTSEVRPRQLRRAASTIFRLAGLHLPEPESRRLEELTQTIFAGDERKKWRAYLEARKTLSRVASLPFDQADRAFATLDELADVHPRRWNAVGRRFRVLHSGWSGDYQSTAGVPSPRSDDERFPLVDAVARTSSLLSNIDEFDTETLRHHLESLAELLDTRGSDADGAALRPIALLWPKLLDASEEIGDCCELLTRIATYYAAHAPTPGYGWWPLAAQLYRAEFADAADVVAERARSASDTTTDNEIRDYVATMRFRRAVDARNAHDARRWLDEIS